MALIWTGATWRMSNEWAFEQKPCYKIINNATVANHIEWTIGAVHLWLPQSCSKQKIRTTKRLTERRVAAQWVGVGLGKVESVKSAGSVLCGQRADQLATKRIQSTWHKQQRGTVASHKDCNKRKQKHKHNNTTTQTRRQTAATPATVGKRHKKAKRETIFSAATGYTRKRGDATPRHAKQIDQRRARAESSTYEAGRQGRAAQERSAGQNGLCTKQLHAASQNAIKRGYRTTLTRW